MKSKVEEHVDEAQFGFRKDKGTSNAIFVLRTIIERAIEKQEGLFMCFVDSEKAFDMVRHDVLMERLRALGIEVTDIRLIVNFYWGQRAMANAGDDKSEWVKIERGVRQGCVLSPDLFSLYSQVFMDEMVDIHKFSWMKWWIWKVYE